VPKAPTGFRAGAAAADITPPVGWRKAGGYDEVISSGIHDPLYAKAVVFEQGGERGAIVVCDLCSVGREVSDRARQAASQRTGIPVPNIVICATHTHGAPEYFGVLWESWRNTSIQKHGRDIHDTMDYVQRVVDGCSTAVAEAWARRSEVTVDGSVPHLPGMAFNRRYLMRDGVTMMNPGKRNNNVVRAAGPVDEEFPIVFFRDTTTGKPKCSFSVFAMHVAVFGGTEFGADFPSCLQSSLREKLGDDFISVFGEGAAGDTNHIDVFSDRPQPPNSEPSRIGGTMAEVFLQAMAGAGRTQPALAVRSARVHIPLQEVTEEQLARAQDVLALRWVPRPGFLVSVEAYRILWNRKLRERDGDAANEEIQAFRLSEEAVILTLPHEVFVELGMAIKKRSPFKTTLVVTLANDVDFYVPTRRAFAEGSYEVTTSPYKPGGGEILVDAAVKLLESLRP
jgi:neutral ceramidase